MDMQNMVDATVSRGFPTSGYINLNVGGVKYTTSRMTLTRYPDSMLGHMFTQESIPLAKDEKGRFMIDRDGRLFSYILNYLRDRELTLPEDFSEHKQLLKEARFYQLIALEEELDKVVNNPSVVTLIVGGVKYLATKATLTKDPKSLLSKMFDEKITGINRDVHGNFIIDRDGVLFRHILNFLRDGGMSVLDDFSEWTLLQNEAEFYELGILEKILSEDPTIVTLIVGGVKYLTTIHTLKKKPRSLLGRNFKENFPDIKRNDYGHFVIDRDGNLFRYILNYLRNDSREMIFPDDFSERKQLRVEVNFYRVGFMDF